MKEKDPRLRMVVWAPWIVGMFAMQDAEAGYARGRGFE